MEVVMTALAQRMNELKYYVLHPTDRLVGDDEQLIRQFETQIGTSLPQEYRDFLARFGGAAFPDTFEAPIREPGHSGEYACPSVFFGFYKPNQRNIPHSLDLTGNYSEYKKRVQRGLLPIAQAIGGNLICLAISGLRRGNIYYWDHETSELLFVASSFGEFLSNLQLTKDEEDEDWNEVDE
jgi:hypothetical protein